MIYIFSSFFEILLFKLSDTLFLIGFFESWLPCVNLIGVLGEDTLIIPMGDAIILTRLDIVKNYY